MTCDAGREVVNPPEAGLAADPTDAVALSEAVCRLLADSEDWDRWSRAARERYRAEMKSRARKNTPKLLSLYFQYVRNLSLVESRMTPDL